MIRGTPDALPLDDSMHHRFLPILLFVALFAKSASGDLIEFHGGFFFWMQAVDNQFNTIDFTGYPMNTIITDQYADQGVTFTNTVSIVHSTTFSDGSGLHGSNGIRFVFDSPQHAVAVSYIGLVTFQFMYQGEVVATSSLFGVGGPLKFAGVVSSQPFDEAYLFNPPPHSNFIPIDNLYWSAVPAPSVLLPFGLAALCARRRRR